MKINVILSVDEDFVIGYKGGLAYHCKEDLQHFRRLTTENVVIMGRKTYESLPKPLKNRDIIIVSNSYFTNNVEVPKRHYVCSSFEGALEFACGFQDIDVFVVGGMSLYNEILPKADKIYMTQFHNELSIDDFNFTQQLLNYEVLVASISDKDWNKIKNTIKTEVNILPTNETKEMNVSFMEFKRK